jgi:hypothetical protein
MQRPAVHTYAARQFKRYPTGESSDFTYTIVWITFQEDLSSSRTRYKRLYLLKLTRRRSPLNPQCLVGDLVLEHTTRVLPSSQDELRVVFGCLDNRLLDVVVDWCLDRA